MSAANEEPVMQSPKRSLDDVHESKVVSNADEMRLAQMGMSLPQTSHKIPILTTIQATNKS
jgi:hypothetical protein